MDTEAQVLNDESSGEGGGGDSSCPAPGGRLHLVDIGGDMTAHDGLPARLMMHNRHAAGNLGDSIPRLLRTAGFDCAEVAVRPRLQMTEVE